MSKEWFIKDGGQVCFKSDNAELNGWDTQSLVDCLNGKEIKIADLQSQLAEKDKEIEEFKYIKIIPTSINASDLEKFKKYLNDTHFISIDTCKSQITLINQNEKAIEQLEKVKELMFSIWQKSCGEELLISGIELIDNQIKELKKEINNV